MPGGRWRTPLRACLEYRVSSTDCLSLFLDAGEDPNGQADPSDPTALKRAAMQDNRDATTMLLLQDGVNVHHVHNWENVAHRLVRSGDIDNFNFLLEKYLTINLRQEGSTGTPLHAAFPNSDEFTDGHDEIVRILLEKGLELGDCGPELYIDITQGLTSMRDWLLKGGRDVPALIRRMVGL